MTDLTTLRGELDAIDAGLIAAIARRQAVVADIGRVKEASGQQLRDFRREAQVLANVRAKALAAGLNPQLAQNVMKQLIEASLVNQEQRRVKHAQEGADKHALILGGNGKMGRWFAPARIRALPRLAKRRKTCGCDCDSRAITCKFADFDRTYRDQAQCFSV
jgi:chorismate mutase